MKRFFAGIAAFLTLAPTLAAASTIEALQEQLKFHLNAMSAITADAPIRCTIYSSKKVVKVNEPFTYGWYASGTNHQDIREGGWQSTGVFTLRNSTAGNWKYKVSFFGKDGTEYPCYLTVTVVP